MKETLMLQSSVGSHKYLLTIAVPTYNRAPNLRLLLDNLAPQLINERRVELIISDNCSPDDTSAVVAEFVQTGLTCRYIRNEENLGADGNFLQCYDRAEGQYLWVFSDDDVIFPGSIAFLLRKMERAEYDLIYVKPFGFFREPNERGYATNTPKTKEVSQARNFVHCVGLNGDFALISSVIVNKSRVDSLPHLPFSDGRTTNLIQLGWVFTALRSFRRGLFVDRGLYSVCEENPSRPFDIAKIFGVNWHKMATLYLDAGSSVQEAVLNDQLYSWFPTHWYGLSRAARRTQTAPPHLLMRPLYGGRPLYWMCVYPLLTLPRPCAGAWLAVIRGIRHVDRAVHAPRG